MTERLRLIACRKCNAPTIVTIDYTTTTCDLPALTPIDEARAWLAHRPTYAIRTFGARQWLLWRNPSPAASRDLVQHLANHTTPDYTILAAHQCPGTPVDIATALDTWKTHDRAVTMPPPVIDTRPPDRPEF